MAIRNPLTNPGPRGPNMLGKLMLKTATLPILFCLALAACAESATSQAAAPSEAAAAPACPAGTITMARFELYLGGSVSDSDWRGFLDTEVTPRFPRGFTYVDAHGQSQLASGAIDMEDTRILIVVVPDNLTAAAYIGAIGQSYTENFAQESVFLVKSDVCAGLVGPGPD